MKSKRNRQAKRAKRAKHSKEKLALERKQVARRPKPSPHVWIERQKQKAAASRRRWIQNRAYAAGTLKKVQDLAREYGVKGYSKWKAADIIDCRRIVIETALAKEAADAR